MFKRLHARALGCLLGLIVAAIPALASDLLDVSWKGDDLFFHFSDSASYSIDLAESDSSQLVIRFQNLTVGSAVAAQGVNMRGPAGRRALLTQSGPNEARLTVLGRGRLGYASLWRPYSHTLVIHTFDWAKLDYPSEQYYKALLALEQGLDAAGLEMLKLAHTTGEPRAASVLGVYYARHGNPAMARQYLTNPADADDNAALAAVAGQSGDSATAQVNRQQFDRKTAQRDTAWQSGGTIDQPRPGLWNEGERRDREPRMDRMKWIYLGGGVVLLLILIWIVVAVSRRSSKRNGAIPATPSKPQFEQVRIDPTPEPAPPVPPAPTPEAKPTVVVEKPVTTPVVEEEIPGSITQESPAVESPATVVTEPQAPATATTQVAEPTAQPAEVAEPAATEPPVAKATTEAAGAKPARPVPTQAAELRRRLEAMREAATTQAPPQPIQTPPTTNKQTITEARRLKLSRDSVELRRRLDEASDRQ